MPTHYREPCKSTKKLEANKLTGLNSGVELTFTNCYLRFYRSHAYTNFFSATLALPTFDDYEGYTLEVPFIEKLRLSPSIHDFDSHLPDSFLAAYEAPLNEHSFESLAKKAKCRFEDTVQQGRRCITLGMEIKDTPFFGTAILDEELYNCTEKQLS